MKRTTLLCTILLFVWLAMSACDGMDFTVISQGQGTPDTSSGQVVQVAFTGGSSIVGKPSISTRFINEVLCKYHSPVCGSGQALYSMGVKYGIDPAWVLAIFWNESNFGRAGEARTSRSIGNLRCLDQINFGDLGTWCQDGYAWFPSWRAGIEACYRLLAGPLYVKDGRITIERIIPRWAPSGDGNSPNHYIAVVKAAVSLWRAGKVQVPA